MGILSRLNLALFLCRKLFLQTVFESESVPKAKGGTKDRQLKEPH